MNQKHTCNTRAARRNGSLIEEDGQQLTSAATGQPTEYWIATTTNDKGNKALGCGMMKRCIQSNK